MNSIAIVGCGNIGSRHLQSCLELDASIYEIFVSEPDQAMKEKAQQIVKASGSALGVSWLDNIDQLPSKIDVVIVATSSKIRKDIALELLANKQVKYLILEKFLFQDALSFSQVEIAIDKAKVPTFVNCPTRIWPIYETIAAELKGKTISRIQVDAPGLDIGCNGIHFVDLIAFLLNSDDYQIEAFKLLDYQAAKREGYLQLSGNLSGNFKSLSGVVPFKVEAPEGTFTGSVLTIDIEGEGDLVCKASGANISVFGSFPRSFSQTNWDMPYQSTLTAACVVDMLTYGRSKLPSYATSKKLHLPLLNHFLDALNEQNALSNPNICPVT